MSFSPELALSELASCYGIESQYQDAMGQMKRITSPTRLALLRAMGVCVADEQSAAAALIKLRTADESQILRPVYVLHQGGNEMRLSVAMPTGKPQFSWTLSFEDGGDIEGTTDFSALTLDETFTHATAPERRFWCPPENIPCGYHQLTFDGVHRAALIVAPESCWLPEAVGEGKRLWGLSVQLYLLRSRKNWGIGDFTDLKRLIEILLPLKAAMVGINPVHAMFLDDPEHASPYSPASRLLLNVLNLDVAKIAQQTPEFDLQSLLRESSVTDELKRSRQSSLVDYAAVARLKLVTLESLFQVWIKEPRGERWQGVERFRLEAGARFEREVTFLALREHFARSGHADWHGWPAAYQNPESPEVARFSKEHQNRVTYQAWLQFWADSQLKNAASAAATMAVGLYRDLAVGANPAGAETWGNQRAVIGNVTVGAPPDIHNPVGQNWGLPPFSPRALQAEAYGSFIDLIRSNMRHAGGLRIDHVMALQHLYWIPAGCAPSAGAYVSYPLADLIGILKLESRRNRCLIVGEDLGTVPEGFREHMAAANILSYRVLFFEKTTSAFLAPAQYPSMAVAVSGSHDLPTLRAWWTGADLDLKQRLNLFPRAEDEAQARLQREADRHDLLVALEAEGLSDPMRDDDAFFKAASVFLARTKSALALVQLDDISDEVSPVNVPTTSNEYPNWRRKVRVDVESLETSLRLRFIAETYNTMR